MSSKGLSIEDAKKKYEQDTKRSWSEITSSGDDKKTDTVKEPGTKTDTVKESGTNTNAEPETNADTVKEPDTVKNVETDNKTFKDIGDVVFQNSSFILLSWFLVVYILAYFVLGMFFGKSNPSDLQVNLGRMLDILLFCGVLLYVITYYYSVPENKFSEDVKTTYNSVITYLNSPYSLITTALFIVMLYTIIYLFRIPMSAEAKPIFVSLIENTAWISFLIVAIISFFKYVLGISLDDLFYKEPEPEPTVPIVEEDEVFNISNNLYSYDDAQAVCSTYGAKIATYDQIENAYNNGAEWCSYGWSENQMAFFPTQKGTWDNLQKDPRTKNNCGRPGVNGGYIANPYIKFGVNCFGKKPKATENDLNRMNAKQNQVFPKSKTDKELDEKVKKWKDNADKVLQISSHNTNKWSRY